jgi:hypothetical protein
MFANIFMLSLLTIIYGTKGDEGGGSAVNFLPQHSSDGELQIFACYRNIVFISILCNFRFKLHQNAEIDKNAL